MIRKEEAGDIPMIEQFSEPELEPICTLIIAVPEASGVPL
jgi:hypothetical protein